jgi:hypothetical protein
MIIASMAGMFMPETNMLRIGIVIAGGEVQLISIVLNVTIRFK